MLESKVKKPCYENIIYSGRYTDSTKGSTYYNPLTRKGRKRTQQRIDQKHIIKLKKRSDKQFISPIVKTVKKDQTVKLALDSKKFNKLIHKNQYQMPNIDLLLDNIAQTIKSYPKEQTLFSSFDLRYAYSQIPLDKKTRDQCNFNLIGGNATGT